MKNFTTVFILLFTFYSGFAQEKILNNPEIMVTMVAANSSFGVFGEYNPPITFGVGTEARLNRFFSLAGSLSYGSDLWFSLLTVRPTCKFYPGKVFRGFFLETGFSYNRVRSKKKPSVGISLCRTVFRSIKLFRCPNWVGIEYFGKKSNFNRFLRGTCRSHERGFGSGI